MRRFLLLTIFVVITSLPADALAQSTIFGELAPQKKLRVAFNANTPIWLIRASDGAPTGGVGFELGKFIAGKIGVVLELDAYPGSSAFIDSFGKGEWDIGLGSQTALRAEKVDFLVDVLLSEYWFIAAPGRKFTDVSQVDRPGVKIGTGSNSASDQFLSKSLKSAQLVLGGNSTEALRNGHVDLWAASASNVQQVAKKVSGATIVPGAFMSERTMLILPKGRSSAAQAKVLEIVAEAKKTGVVQKALEKAGVKGIRAAP